MNNFKQNLTCPLKHDNDVKEFMENGFLVFKNFFSEILSDLQNLASKNTSVNSGYFNYSLMELNVEENISLHNNIISKIQRFIDEILIEYKVLSTTLLIKPLGFNEEMLLHQDWSFTDEQKFVPITIWIPLIDVNQSNGALFLIPKSHNLFNNYRSKNYETARLLKSNQLAKYSIDLNVNAGDLVLFHPAVFHGSYPNNSNKNRIVIAATILPKEAPYYHVRKISNLKASIEYLKEGAFFKDLALLNDSSAFCGYKQEEKKYEHKIITEKELIGLLNKIYV